MEKLADIGVFGGSGFYKFLDDIKEVKSEEYNICTFSRYDVWKSC